MIAGELAHKVAYMLPAGVDADVWLYFVSDATGLQCKFGVQGVTMFAPAQGFLTEAQKIMSDATFQVKATDWRLMTTEEVIAYRKHEQQEAARADHDHQEERRAGPAQG